LDQISEGEKDWIRVLSEFNEDLSRDIDKFASIVGEESSKIVSSDVDCPCGNGKMILKSGRYGRYLGCCNEAEACDAKISLRGIDIPVEDIKNGMIYVKEAVEHREEIKRGRPTDVFTEQGARCLLKLGRFGSYLESENFATDEIRMPLPPEIRKMLASGTETVEHDIVKLKSFLDKLKAEDDEILKHAGVCEKCGSPFKIMRGRWGKFLACTGYPDCKNIKKIDKAGKTSASSEETAKVAVKKTLTKKATKPVTKKSTIRRGKTASKK
jgi:DNA topoisomerase-1